MRLLEIRYVLSINLEKLHVDANDIPGSPNINLTGFSAGVEAAKVIKKTGVLQKETKALLVIKEIANSALDEIVVTRKTATLFVSAMNELKSHTEIIYDTLEEFLKKGTKESVSIKLPISNDLEEIANTMSKLKLALEQSLVNPFVNGHIELIGFDRGSNWIDVGLGSLLALQFLGAMIRLIYESKNKEIELATKREMVRSVKIQNDLKEKFCEAIDKELEEYYSHRVDNLLSIAKIDKPEPEYPARLGHSLRLLSELVSKGLEVHPSLIAPKEEIDKFPDPKRLFEVFKSLPACDNNE